MPILIKCAYEKSKTEDGKRILVELFGQEAWKKIRIVCSTSAASVE